LYFSRFSLFAGLTPTSHHASDVLGAGALESHHYFRPQK